MEGMNLSFFALSSHLKLKIGERNGRYEELAFSDQLCIPCSEVRSPIYIHGVMLTCQHAPLRSLKICSCTA